MIMTTIQQTQLYALFDSQDYIELMWEGSHFFPVLFGKRRGQEDFVYIDKVRNSSPALTMRQWHEILNKSGDVKLTRFQARLIHVLTRQGLALSEIARVFYNRYNYRMEYDPCVTSGDGPVFEVVSNYIDGVHLQLLAMKYYRAEGLETFEIAKDL